MMSCLTSGSRLERNAPHQRMILQQDQLHLRAAFTLRQNSLCVEKIFFVNGDGLMVSGRHFLHSGVVFLHGIFQSPAQFSGRGPTGAPSP